MTALKNHSLRLWPNGEFGVGVYRKYRPEAAPSAASDEGLYRTSWTLSELGTLQNAITAYGSVTAALERMSPGFMPCLLEEIAQRGTEGISGSAEKNAEAVGGGASLGSSNASNSHKRAPRGSGGLTSYGRKMVRNCTWLLAKAAGHKKTGMVTATIPGCTMSVQRRIVEKWAEIVRIFTQWLHRRLRAAGAVVPWVVGVTEIQEGRRRREGGLPLHLHCVYVARKHRQFFVDKDDVRAAWERAVCSQVPCAKNLNWVASTRVESVRKSVTNYLAKYMTKGSPEAMRCAASEGFEMPKSWWFAVGKCKSYIKRQMHYYTDERADKIWAIAHSNPEIFHYIHKVVIERDGREFVIGIAGKMTAQMADWVKNCA